MAHIELLGDAIVPDGDAHHVAADEGVAQGAMRRLVREHGGGFGCKGPMDPFGKRDGLCVCAGGQNKNEQ
ncbi:MAG: hypothetical protein IPH60_01750 [Flavobacteriales bacterium]|nr:hypothetical protein [Flavobacteriales bacterium]